MIEPATGPRPPGSESVPTTVTVALRAKAPLQALPGPGSLTRRQDAFPPVHHLDSESCTVTPG